MLVLGLTGGIACGKTTVAGWLRQLGASLVDADEISRGLTRLGGPGLPAIRQAFGDKVFTPEGALNRAALAALVFASPEQRRSLNSILHPMIESEMKKEIAACRKEGASIVVLDVPLLYETGMEALADKVLCVSAAQETQIARLQARDGLSRSQALQRIHSQWPLAQKEARADFVLFTDRPGTSPREECAALYRQLLALR